MEIKLNVYCSLLSPNLKLKILLDSEPEFSTKIKVSLETFRSCERERYCERSVYGKRTRVW